MNRDEFIKNYSKFAKYAAACAEKARREGFLSIEDKIDQEKVLERDIFEYGMSFVVDGTDGSLIESILSNIIAQEEDEYAQIFKTIQLEAVLSIQAGDNTRILLCKLNSLTELSIKDDPVIQAYKTRSP